MDVCYRGRYKRRDIRNLVNVVHGGVILFRGSGADARRYVEADRSRADDYYLGADATVATFTALDSSGAVSTSMKLDPADYAAWVDWTDLLTSESMGTPRMPGDGRRGSPRFAEMVVNTPKSPVDCSRAAPGRLRRSGPGAAGCGGANPGLAC